MSFHFCDCDLRWEGASERERTKAGFYWIVITSNQSDRWVLEWSARFHAADGLAVCVWVCVYWLGASWPVWWCVLECQVCIYQCFHWFCISKGRLNLLCVCLRSCTFAYLSVHKHFCVMYVSRTHKQNPKTHIRSLRLCDKILSLWLQYEKIFYMNDQLFYMNNRSNVLSNKPTGNYYSLSWAENSALISPVSSSGIWCQVKTRSDKPTVHYLIAMSATNKRKKIERQTSLRSRDFLRRLRPNQS